jgi:SAM-dependent methyltransferase
VARVIDIGPQPVSNRFLRTPSASEETFPIALQQCLTCGLIQIEEPVPARALAPPYDWITYNEPEAHLDGLVDIVAALPGVGPGAVAAGVSFKDDSTLARLERKGLQTWRLDLHEDLAVHDGRSGYGVETIQDRLTPAAAAAIAARRGRADLLLVRHILEHASQPLAFMEALRILTAPGGYVVVEVPDCSRAMDACDYTTIWEEHTLYYTPETFRNGLALAAFDVVRAENYPYPFENSLVAIATANGGATGGRAPAAGVARERERGLAFGRSLPEHRDRIRRALAEHRQGGGSIARFGAGHLARTWIGVFRVEDVIDCVIDDNPNKRGLFMPGSKLPIVGSSALVERGITLCLLSLNPIGQERVIAQNAAFVARRRSDRRLDRRRRRRAGAARHARADRRRARSAERRRAAAAVPRRRRRLGRRDRDEPHWHACARRMGKRAIRGPRRRQGDRRRQLDRERLRRIRAASQLPHGEGGDVADGAVLCGRARRLRHPHQRGVPRDDRERGVEGVLRGASGDRGALPRDRAARPHGDLRGRRRSDGLSPEQSGVVSDGAEHRARRRRVAAVARIAGAAPHRREDPLMATPNAERGVRPAVVHRDTCRLCDSRDLSVLLQLEPTPPGDHYVTADALDVPQPAYPMTLVMCGQCGLAQLPDVVDPEILYRDYIYNSSISLGLVRHFDEYAQSVLARVGTPEGSLIVDVGSNDGTLLRAFRSRGMRVLGVDPAREVARKAAAAGLETVNAFFDAALASELRRERGAASIVTANNVFANVDDLHDFVEGVRRLLAADGVFVFETGYFPDLVRQSIIDNIYQEHLSYYSVKPLARFFERYGMRLVAVEHEPTKGGSIRGFVQLAECATRLSRGALDELVDAEASGGFDRPDQLGYFTRRIAALRGNLKSLVADIRSQGRTLAGYGASVGVTTLLYYFDLGRALSFLVDDNPVRHGRFTPGHHIPVLSSDALYDRRPDDVILLAWRYAQPIIGRHEKYRQAGGRFILPLPEIAFL